MRKYRILLIITVALVLLGAMCACTPKEQAQESGSIALNFKESELTASKFMEDIEQNVDTSVTYSDNDIIEAFIVVDDRSVAASYLESGESVEFSTWAAGASGRKLHNALISSQEAALQQLSERGINYSVSYNYTTLLNAVAVKVRFGDLDVLDNLNNIIGVSVSQAYTVPEVESVDWEWGEYFNLRENTEDFLFDNHGMINNNTEYTGEGAVIAIIDTGLDYVHSAFNTIPEFTSLNKTDIEPLMPLLMANSSGEYSADDLFINGKLPFGYDYADNDSDVNPFSLDKTMQENNNAASFTLYHGTHVAGIAAGDDDVIRGVAYKAQLAIMKVGSNTDGSIPTTAMYAAFCDSVLLGVDVINMSIGRACGLTRYNDPAQDYMNQVFDLMENLGISLCISAGNDYYSSIGYGEGGAQGYANTTAPDTGTMGAPGSFPETFAVASAENDYYFFGELNGEKMLMSNAADLYDSYRSFFDLLTEKKQTFQFTVVPGLGAPEDYEGIDVNGKIAVVRRGDLSFEEKALNAEAAGAIAIIITDDSGENMRPALPHTCIPTAFTQQGEAMMQAGSGNITFNKEDVIYISSIFSSWGPTIDLDMGVDIMTPGGYVLSAYCPTYLESMHMSEWQPPYVPMSGTSMASPNMAGASAVMIMQLKDFYPEMTGNERIDMLYRLAMSTANIVTDKEGTPISPRQQGAGMIDLEAAMNTKAYLTVTGSDKVKLNLGSDLNKDGIYTLRFNLVNRSQEALSYELNVYAMTETALDGKMMQQGHLFEGIDIEFSAVNAAVNGYNITVEAGQTAALKVVIRLNEEHKAYMDDNFANGIYVEGYAELVSLSGDHDLSIPYISYYGDWDALPYLEPTPMDNEPIEYDLTQVILYQYLFDGLGRYQTYLGFYPWHTLFEPEDTDDIKDPAYDQCAMSYNTELATLELHLLRSVERIDLSISDSIGNVLYGYDVFYDMPKDYFSGANIYNVNLSYYLSASNPLLLWANNQIINFEVTVWFSVEKNISTTILYPIFIDYEAPTLVSSELREEEGRTYLDLEIYDNHYLACADLYNLEGNVLGILTPYSIPDKDFVKNSVNGMTIDITDYIGNITQGKLAIELTDYACNQIIYEIDVPYFQEEEEEVNGVNSINSVNNGMSFNSFNSSEEDFVIEDGVLVGYNGEGGEVIIPDGVTSIAANVFKNNKSITKVVFPEGLISIGNSAFEMASYLTEVKFASTIESIGQKAFKGCMSLESADFEVLENIKSLGAESFVGTGFKELVIPECFGNLEYLGETKSSYHPDILLYTPAFALLLNLEKLTINAVVNISDSFMICPVLKEVDINADIDIGLKSFTGCNALEVLRVNVDITKFGSESAYKDSSYDYTDYGYGEAWADDPMYNYAVYGENEFTLYSSYSSWSFSSAPSLRQVIFAGNVGSIEGFVFNDCPELTEVRFAGSVGYISSAAFNGSPKVSIVLEEGNDKMLLEDGVLYDVDKTRMYMLPNWDYEGVFEVPFSVKELANGQFAGGVSAGGVPLKVTYTLDETTCKYSLSRSGSSSYIEKTSMTGVKLHSDITIIPIDCFSYCAGFETLDYNGAVITKVGSNAFTGTNIEELIFPESVTSIGAAFAKACPRLVSFELPENLQYLGALRFANCISLKELVLPEIMGIYRLYSGDLSGCESLELVVLHSGYKSIQDEFNNLVNLKKIEGMENIEQISNGAFWYGICYIEEMTFGKNLKYIYDNMMSLDDTGWYRNTSEPCYTLGKLPNLKTLYIEEGSHPYFAVPRPGGRLAIVDVIYSLDFIRSPLEQIIVDENHAEYSSEDGIMYNKEKSEVLFIPVSVELERLELSENVKTIGSGLFNGVTNIKSISLPGVTTVLEGAFANSEFESFYAPNLTYIYSGAFQNCQWADQVDLTNVKYIGSYAFAGTNITEAVLPNVEQIDFGAFEGSTLTSVSVGPYLSGDLSRMFLTNSFESLTVDPTNQNYSFVNNGIYSNDGVTLYFYQGTESNVILPDGLVRIANNAFINNLFVTDVTFPASLTNIGDKAFFGCENLKNLTFLGNAPMLEGLYIEGAHYPYANFVDVVGTEGIDLNLFRYETASGFDAIIWDMYFTNQSFIPADSNALNVANSANSSVQLSAVFSDKNAVFALPALCALCAAAFVFVNKRG